MEEDQLFQDYADVEDKDCQDLKLSTKRRSSGHKQYYCVFCGKLEYKIPRHCENNHKSEDLVQKALSFPKGSKGRTEAWRKISADGDFKANIECRKKSSGVLVVARNKQNASVEEFTPCEFCHQFFHSRTLYKHSKSCSFKTKEDSSKDEHSHLKASRALLSVHIYDDNFNETRAVLSKMKRNILHIIIRNDPALLLFGTIQLRKKEKERYSDIRYSLRCLARCLQEFRKISGKESASAKELVFSGNYDLILKSTKNISGYTGPREIKTPSLFLKVGFCLTNLCEYLRCAALKVQDRATVEDFQNFAELYSSDWQIYATNARATYEVRKANKPAELPLEEDVKKFRVHLLKTLKEFIVKVSTESPTLQDLKSLSEYTLARVMTFNARRGGECSKLTLANWEAVEDGRRKRRTDLENLDGIEKKLAERMEICYVEGKKMAKTAKKALVPILFTDEVKQAIKILVTHRNVLGVNMSNNPYVFAAGGSCLKGWNTLQKISKAIPDLEKPKLITPTRTRKFLATTLQLMDMNEAELTWVTNHFGHSKDVHYQWYRQEDATIELTKVAKVLCAVDDGKSVKNKRIDDVNGDLSDEDQQDVPIATSTPVRTNKRRVIEGEALGQEKEGSEEELSHKKRKTWTKWNAEENKAIETLFAHFIKRRVYPQHHDILFAMKRNDLLNKRGLEKVKHKIKSQIKSLKVQDKI